jgi:cytochrome c5
LNATSIPFRRAWRRRAWKTRGSRRACSTPAGALGAYATGIGGIRLMVHEADLAAARSALETDASVEAPDVPESEDILRAERYCAVCHSTDIEVGERRTPAGASWFRRLWDAIFGPAPRLRCRRCDHVWTG